MQFATGRYRFSSDASVTHKDGLRPKYLQQLNFNLLSRSEMERRHSLCMQSAVKQPRHTTNLPHDNSCMISHAQTFIRERTCKG